MDFVGRYPRIVGIGVTIERSIGTKFVQKHRRNYGAAVVCCALGNWRANVHLGTISYI